MSVSQGLWEIIFSNFVVLPVKFMGPLDNCKSICKVNKGVGRRQTLSNFDNI